MAFTAPAATDLKALYPAFAAVSDATVTAALGDAALDVGASWIDGHRAPAMMALAAHRLSCQGVLTNGDVQDLVAGLGTVTGLRAGDTDVRFADPNKAEAIEPTGYARTTYGRRFLELRARSFPAVAIV